MKIDHYFSKEVVSSFGAGTAFKADMNGFAFSILSDGIYKYKVEAIIRELASNAYDSHVSAGKADVPFIVNLPNAFSPVFSIEDFGVGLSEEEVYDVFSVYFGGSKKGTNDVVGGFGLGSKTPFSYTDKFIVVSRKNGKETTYVASIGADGCPTIAPISSILTDASNGVKISINIDSGDERLFRSAAEAIFSFFDPMPVIRGVHNFKPNIENAAARLKEDGFLFVDPGTDCSSKLYNWRHYSFIKQGPVIYPHDKRHIFNSQTMIIEVPIGTFMPLPSREGLQTTETFDKDVDALFANALDKAKKKIQAEIDSKPTALEAFSVFYGYFKSTNVENYFTYRNKPFFKSFSVDNLFGFDAKARFRHVDKVDSSILKGSFYAHSKGNPFVVFVNDTKQKPTRVRRNVREYVKENGIYYGFLYLGKYSELRVKRILTLFRDSLKVVKLSEIKDVKLPKKEPAAKKEKTEKTAETVYCRPIYDGLSQYRSMEIPEESYIGVYSETPYDDFLFYSLLNRIVKSEREDKKYLWYIVPKATKKSEKYKPLPSLVTFLKDNPVLADGIFKGFYIASEYHSLHQARKHSRKYGYFLNEIFEAYRIYISKSEHSSSSMNTVFTKMKNTEELADIREKAYREIKPTLDKLVWIRNTVADFERKNPEILLLDIQDYDQA